MKNHTDVLFFNGNLRQNFKYDMAAVRNLRFLTRVIAVNCFDIVENIGRME